MANKGTTIKKIETFVSKMETKLDPRNINKGHEESWGKCVSIGDNSLKNDELFQNYKSSNSFEYQSKS